MELAAVPGTIAEEAFEELHLRRHDDRSIPVLTSEAVHDGVVLGDDVAVMLDQHWVSERWLEHAPEHVRSLVQDRDVRKRDDHTLEAVMYGVLHRKGQGRQSLPASRWHRQGIGAPRTLGCVKTPPQNAASLLDHRGWGQGRQHPKVRLDRSPVVLEAAPPSPLQGTAGSAAAGVEVRVPAQRERPDRSKVNAGIGAT